MERHRADPHSIVADLAPSVHVPDADRVWNGVLCSRRRFLLLAGTLPLIRVTPLPRPAGHLSLAGTRAMFARKVSG